MVAVDHLFTLIASAAAKFNLEQLNYLIGFIYDVIDIVFLSLIEILFVFFSYSHGKMKQY